MLVLILVRIFYSHSTPINQVINERDILGTQLIRRNDELALLYEKLKIQQSTLKKVRTGRMRVRGEPGRAGPARGRAEPQRLFCYTDKSFSRSIHRQHALFFLWLLNGASEHARPTGAPSCSGKKMVRLIFAVCVCALKHLL